MKEKTFCCNPPLDQELVFFYFLKKKNIDVEQEAQPKIRGKPEIRKRNFKDKARQKLYATERIAKTTFECDILMLFFS